MLVNLLNLINTHLHTLNLNTLIYLHEPGDLAKSNLVIHFPKILSRMPLAETNLVIRFPVFLLQMPLAEANIVNTLDFIYIEHNIYCNCIHRYYRESIFIHYSYVTFYACSFPHNNKHTYIRYIFKVSISMCKCSYDSILLYSYI